MGCVVKPYFMSSLVVKKWKIDTSPIDEDNNYFKMEARQAGIIGWLLALFGIDPTTTISLSPDRLDFYSTSLSGKMKTVTHISDLGGVTYAYKKPLWQSVGLFLLIALGGTAIANEIDSIVLAITSTLAALAVSLLYFYIKKQLVMIFHAVGGLGAAIVFSPSVIEGQSIDGDSGENVIELTLAFIQTAKGEKT